MFLEAELLDRRRREFFDNIWDHTQDPFFEQFDFCLPLEEWEIRFFVQVHEKIISSDDEKVAEFLRSFVESLSNHENRVKLVARLLQLCGLTRSKIVTDLRSRKLRVSSYKSIYRNAEVWNQASLYIAVRLRRIFRHLVTIDKSVLEALNEATYPAFIRQERAKRQGHEAEFRFARLLQSLGLPFEPLTKAYNPLSGDVKIQGESFDIVIPDSKHPRVLIKSTVHTANIGQYGESKDALEMERAREMIQKHFPEGKRPLLAALIDGVGFNSNREGLDSILRIADEFFQFNTFWKGVVIAASQTGRIVQIEDEQAHLKSEHFQGFIERYSHAIEIMENLSEGVKAGMVRVRLKEGHNSSGSNSEPISTSGVPSSEVRRPL